MWKYEKRLQHPVNITTPNSQLAQFIASQYGGPYCKNMRHQKSTYLRAFLSSYA